MVFTGGKIKEAIELWKKYGGDIGSSVTASTVALIAKDPTAQTTKIQSAIRKGVQIIGQDEIIDFIN